MAKKDLNQVSMVGRLTRDAEIKMLQSGTAVADFSIANNTIKKRGENWDEVANFFQVSYFGKAAQGVSPYLLKGTQIAISGELEFQSWEGNDGAKRSKVVIKASTVQLLSKPRDSGEYAPRQSTQPTQSPKFQSGSSKFEGKSSLPENFDDDIPF